MIQLITGGAGFIGSNYLFYLLENYPDERIICVDSLTYAGNYHTIDDLIKDNRIEFIKADITDAGSIDKIFSNHDIDVVVNFAAESHVDRSIEDSSVFLMTNIIGTQVLLDACKNHGVNRFHQVSTDEVYGDLPMDNKELLFTETTSLKPSSPYSASKTSADLLAMAYFKTHGINVTISRCSNNYGPYQFPEKLIPLMIINTLNNKKLPVYGDGLNIRDWLYVDDHCEAIYEIVKNGKIGEVYNIGGNNEKANIEIVKTILSALEKDESLIEYVIDRKGHDRRYAIDSSKMRNELGWEPKTDFDSGIKKTIDWYLSNKDWWEQIVSGEYQDYYNKMYNNREI